MTSVSPNIKKAIYGLCYILKLKRNFDETFFYLETLQIFIKEVSFCAPHHIPIVMHKDFLKENFVTKTLNELLFIKISAKSNDVQHRDGRIFNQESANEMIYAFVLY